VINAYERDARAKKVQALVRYLNRMFSDLELDPTNPRDRLLIGAAVRNFNDLTWRQLAINTGGRPASAETRAAVINEYTKTVAETGRLLNEAM
jgi:hypothetical protein